MTAAGSSGDGLGLVAPARMVRQGYDIQLTGYGLEGWQAIFSPAGREPAPTRAVGSAGERRPGQAVERTARMAV